MATGRNAYIVGTDLARVLNKMKATAGVHEDLTESFEYDAPKYTSEEVTHKGQDYIKSPAAATGHIWSKRYGNRAESLDGRSDTGRMASNFQMVQRGNSVTPDFQPGATYMYAQNYGFKHNRIGSEIPGMHVFAYASALGRVMARRVAEVAREISAESVKRIWSNFNITGGWANKSEIRRRFYEEINKTDLQGSEVPRSILGGN